MHMTRTEMTDNNTYLHSQNNRNSKMMSSFNASIRCYYCDYCQYSCAFRSDLIKHTRTHTGEKPYPCPFCNYRGTQRHHLSNHIKTHRFDIHDLNSCPICSLNVIDINDLSNHIIDHHVHDKG